VSGLATVEGKKRIGLFLAAVFVFFVPDAEMTVMPSRLAALGANVDGSFRRGFVSEQLRSQPGVENLEFWRRRFGLSTQLTLQQS